MTVRQSLPTASVAGGQMAPWGGLRPNPCLWKLLTLSSSSWERQSYWSSGFAQGYFYTQGDEPVPGELCQHIGEWALVAMWKLYYEDRTFPHFSASFGVNCYSDKYKWNPATFLCSLFYPRYINVSSIINSGLKPIIWPSEYLYMQSEVFDFDI